MSGKRGGWEFRLLVVKELNPSWILPSHQSAIEKVIFFYPNVFPHLFNGIRVELPKRAVTGPQRPRNHVEWDSIYSDGYPYCEMLGCAFHNP